MPNPLGAFTASRRALIGTALFVVLSTFALSACAEDDEDRIDAFIAAVTGEVTSERIDHALTTYLDLAQKPLSATFMGEMRLYRIEDGARLRQLVHDRLQRFLGTSIKVLRRRIDIQGGSARVELQVYGDGGMGNLIYELAKVDNRWFMTVVRVGN